MFKSKVAFGGPDLETLYVTTAAEGGKPEPAGGLFKITGLGVSGLPMSNFKLYWNICEIIRTN